MSRSLVDYSKPLTDEERRFAEERHGIVYYYLNQGKLNENEYYDAAVIGYLRAVRKYVNIPRAREYAFSTIAYRAMDTSIYTYNRSEYRLYKHFTKYAVTEDGFNIIDYIADSRDDYENIFVSEELNKVWSLLSEREKTIFILKSRGYTNSEICKVFGLTIAGIASRIKRVRKSLREQLNNMEVKSF